MKNEVSDMKLAEALQERADLNRRVEQLRARLSNNVVMQEGVKPVESPDALLSEMDALLNRLEALIIAINRTNMATVVDGAPLSDALARRDVLKMRINMLRNVVDQASRLAQRSRGDEIRQLSAVDVRALQRQVDDLSRDFRLLDNRVQAANWATELIEN